jgi:SAM-dependent MidA family methyltransferase
MERALYAPGTGYYARERDPFGREGDFYTAAQMQPVFGRLIAAAIAEWKPERILDWGGGRGEMRESLAPMAEYVLVERGAAMPEAKSGTTIFANELFDALPVDVAQRGEDGVWREMRVREDGGEFKWAEGEQLHGEWSEYARGVERWLPSDGCWWIELPVEYGAVLDAMTRVAPDGKILAIDYGYTQREALRFPRGTLMSYRRHRAVDDVLRAPGEQDITAHVAWTRLEEEAARRGWKKTRMETMASLLMRAGEKDAFEGALAGDREKMTQQLKTLVFGMGESFQAMLLERE